MNIMFKAGAGKSVIWCDNLSIVCIRGLMPVLLASSAIIEDIRVLQKSGLASLAFFYCDFREDQKKDRRGLHQEKPRVLASDNTRAIMSIIKITVNNCH